MKLNIKGKSDKVGFNVTVESDDLLAFFQHAIEKAQGEYDPELATSPGGFPTAVFTAMLPASARESVGWDIVKEGWNQEKAIAAFESRLERKSSGGVTIEQRQAAWDKRAELMRQTVPGITEELLLTLMGSKRPEKKAE